MTELAGILGERLTKRTSALASSGQGGQTCPRGRNPITAVLGRKTPSKALKTPFSTTFWSYEKSWPWDRLLTALIRLDSKFPWTYRSALDDAKL